MVDFADHDDERDLTEIPPSEPKGEYRVEVRVPVPTIEQVTAEIARQVIANASYPGTPALMNAARASLDRLIDDAVTRRALPIIEELLTKPLQPTDAFGVPIGEPTSLQSLIAQRVTAWCTDPVDAKGLATKPTTYGDKPAPRMAWMLGALINGEMKTAIDAEVKRLQAELKTAATAGIARQIAEKIAGMVLK